MKLKACFITHQTGQTHILISADPEGFSGLVRSNETAAFIIEQLKQDTTPEQIVEALLGEYDVARDQAARDVDGVLSTLRAIGALDL